MSDQRRRPDQNSRRSRAAYVAVTLGLAVLAPLNFAAAQTQTDALAFDEDAREFQIANNAPPASLSDGSSEFAEGSHAYRDVSSVNERSLDERRLPPPTVRSVDESLQKATGHDLNWLMQRGGIGLAIFVALVAVQRVFVPETKGKLQQGAVQVCGKVRLDAKQFLHLVRIGERMLVLLESPTGMQRLAEITDPAEIERIVHPHARKAPRDPSPRVEQVANSATELLEQIRRVER